MFKDQKRNKNTKNETNNETQEDKQMIRVFETFSGYGGASFALKKAKIPFKCIGYSEVDKYAIQCYDQNHKGIKNFGDISKIKINDLPDFDILTGGFPCQDVSIAGKRDLSKGRTLLIEHVFRIIKAKKPTYLLLENVRGLLSMPGLWDSIRLTLKNLGYGVAWKVLNSKHYGIPQNRERIWIVCKKGGWDFMEFMFPEKEKLNIFIKDILEKDVEEKYFLNEKQIKRMKSYVTDKRFNGRINIIKNHETISNCQTAGQYKDPPIIADFRFDEGLRIRKDGCSPYLAASNRESLSKSILVQIGKWRRLTPKECFRLMGFLNDGINLKGLSDTQCYKLAGNGWDINIVSKILKKLFKGENK